MTTPQNDPAGPASTALPEQEADDIRTRLDGLAAQFQRIPEMIREAVNGAHGQAEQHEAKKLDRPSEAEGDIGAVVRKAVADHDKQKERAAKERGERDGMAKELADLKAKVEQPPAPFKALRRHRVMGWGE